MSGEVKLDVGDYTVFWETLLFMSNILCQISWNGPFDAYSLSMLFYLENAKKTFATNVFCEYDKTQDLNQSTCLTLHLHQIWWLKLEKLIQESQYWSPH